MQNEEIMFSLFSANLQKKALIAINTYNSLKDSEEKQKAIQPVFLQAIKSADIATIQLLSHYVAINRYFQNPEEKSNTETTYLMQAVKFNQEKVIQLLITYRANINAPDRELSANRYGNKFIEKETPLIKAAEISPTHCIQLLLEQKGNVKTTNDKGETALHLAAARGSDLAVEILLDARADVMARTEGGRIPYTYAIRQGGMNRAAQLIAKNMRASHAETTSTAKCTIM